MLYNNIFVLLSLVLVGLGASESENKIRGRCHRRVSSSSSSSSSSSRCSSSSSSSSSSCHMPSSSSSSSFSLCDYCPKPCQKPQFFGWEEDTTDDAQLIVRVVPEHCQESHLELYNNSVKVYSSNEDHTGTTTIPLALGIHQLSFNLYAGHVLPISFSSVDAACPTGYSGSCARFGNKFYVCYCQAV